MRHTNGKGKGSLERVLITGGAGFVGTNLAKKLLESGRPVTILDNLSRPGVERNLLWLQAKYGKELEFIKGDVREPDCIRSATQDVGVVFHFAAQVAVTTSLVSPVDDFEVNARGSLNVLEAVRGLDSPVPVIFTSTNKVYGGLDDVEMVEGATRYEPASLDVRTMGVSEGRPLDFHSPYGCSKGCADQYMIDYARTMDVPSVVFRMSCIYGPHQFGTEDQGWVAHFLIQAMQHKPITIYGDGKQVRDVLFVEDLVEAFLAASERAPSLSGQAFNIGGGPKNTVSLLEYLAIIEDLTGSAPQVGFDAWRPGDQRYYVSDTSKFTRATGWRQRHTVREGVEQLFEWLGGVVADPSEAVAV